MIALQHEDGSNHAAAAFDFRPGLKEVKTDKKVCYYYNDMTFSSTLP
jgi:hypothetical protein